MFTTEEPYLAVPMGGQVSWVAMRSGPPEKLAELKFVVRAAQTSGGQREISLCLNMQALEVLRDKAQEALDTAAGLGDYPPLCDVGQPVTETT